MRHYLRTTGNLRFTKVNSGEYYLVKESPDYSAKDSEPLKRWYRLELNSCGISVSGTKLDFYQKLSEDHSNFVYLHLGSNGEWVFAISDEALSEIASEKILLQVSKNDRMSWPFEASSDDLRSPKK